MALFRGVNSDRDSNPAVKTGVRSCNYTTTHPTLGRTRAFDVSAFWATLVRGFLFTPPCFPRPDFIRSCLSSHFARLPQIAYHRSPPTVEGTAVPEPEPLPQGRRMPSRAPTPYTGDNPQPSDSCEDYSFIDRLSDICHSVFRGGGAAHHPLSDDTDNDGNVNP